MIEVTTTIEDMKKYLDTIHGMKGEKYTFLIFTDGEYERDWKKYIDKLWDKYCTIRIHKHVRARLKLIKSEDEAYGDVILRLISHNSDSQKCEIPHRMKKCKHESIYRNYVFDQQANNIIPRVDVCMDCNWVLLE